MYYIHTSHNIVTFSIDSDPVVNHIWTCSCVFYTGDAFKRSTVGSSIPVVFHCHGMVEPNHSHRGPTALMLQYRTCYKHSNTLCSGQNVLPKALQVFTEFQTDSPNFYKLPTHLAMVNTDFPNIYKPPARFT